MRQKLSKINKEKNDEIDWKFFVDDIEKYLKGEKNYMTKQWILGFN